uniref:ATP synthase subunit a n=1 Tax=Helopeltis sp. TaxID=2931293 RepID=A0A8T9ZXV8_9HEMI|nr:ATPase subunit 6 [Helopeltis sp.]
MMTNLFSSFDPATSMYLSMNWLSSILGIMIIPSSFWIMPNRMSIMFNKISSSLTKEYNMLLNSKSSNMNMLLISLFMLIMFNNLMGLLPYIFTSSSHISFTLTMALPMWMGIMIYGWANKTQKMFAHMIPNGVPPLLMPFMVIIETISNLIRPGSLAVRLTANMIAGHLFMSMLGNNMPNTNIIMMMILSLQMVLMLFETAVSIIQAYVFSTLMTLYTSEVN